VAGRARAGRDASEAGVAVLAQQRHWQEPLAADEQLTAFRLDTGLPPDAQRQSVDAIVRALALRPQ
jgi:predicted kinase